MARKSGTGRQLAGWRRLGGTWDAFLKFPRVAAEESSKPAKPARSEHLLEPVSRSQNSHSGSQSQRAQQLASFSASVLPAHSTSPGPPPWVLNPTGRPIQVQG